MSRSYLLIINGAVLAGCAVFDFAWRTTLLTALMLFLPFVDKHWQSPAFQFNKKRLFKWSGTLLLCVFLLTIKPDYLTSALSILVFTALPEEWFFRAYFLNRLEDTLKSPINANIASSILFALLHYPTQGLFGLTVFFPSVILGRLYQRDKDLLLVILIHTLFNIFFILFIKPIL